MWRKIQDFFRIESLTTRVRLAFMSIILLLIFSGVMSLVELQRVSSDTEEILMASKSNSQLAVEMLTALEQQDKAMFRMAIEGDNINDHRAVCEQGIRNLESSAHRAKDVVSKGDNPQSADSLIIFTNRLNALSRSYLNHEVENQVKEYNEMRIAAQMAAESNIGMFTADMSGTAEESFDTATEEPSDTATEESTATSDTTEAPVAPVLPVVHQVQQPSTFSAHQWYIKNYLVESENVLRHIKKYMSGAQNTLGPDVNNLSHTAHRAVKPVFITQVVMIVIVLIFYFFFMLYFVKPVLRINRSLGSYLAYRTPFDDSITSRDEIRTVRDRIAALISRIR